MNQIEKFNRKQEVTKKYKEDQEARNIAHENKVEIKEQESKDIPESLRKKDEYLEQKTDEYGRELLNEDQPGPSLEDRASFKKSKEGQARLKEILERPEPTEQESLTNISKEQVPSQSDKEPNEYYFDGATKERFDEAREAYQQQQEEQKQQDLEQEQEDLERQQEEEDLERQQQEEDLEQQQEEDLEQEQYLSSQEYQDFKEKLNEHKKNNQEQHHSEEKTKDSFEPDASTEKNQESQFEDKTFDKPREKENNIEGQKNIEDEHQKDEAQKRKEQLNSRASTFQKRADALKKTIEKTGNPQQREKLKQQLLVLNERKKILEKRTHNLEQKMRTYHERNASLWEKLKSKTKRNWKGLQTWYEKPENRKQLAKRVLIGAGISTTLGAFGIGAGVVVGVAGTISAYVGQGVGRGVYDRHLRGDFREKLLKLRREGLQNSNPEQAQSAYLKRLKELTNKEGNFNETFSKSIKRNDRKKMLAGIAGGFIFGASARGLVSGIELMSDSPTVENQEPPVSNSSDETQKIETPQKTPQETPQEPPQENPQKVPPVIEETPHPENTEKSINFEDIKIREGEGITHAFVRQIKHSPELQEYFGLSSESTDQDIIKASARAARETGYLSDTDEVRVFLDQNAGYELLLDEQGKLLVNEYEGITIDPETKNYQFEKLDEVHHQGDAFEGQDIEREREYLHSEERQSSQNNEITDDSYSDLMKHTSEEPPQTDIEGSGYSDLMKYTSEEPPQMSGGGIDIEQYIPSSNTLGEKVRDFGLGSPMSQVSLPEKLGGYNVPQKFLNLFQNNQENPDLFMRLDTEKDATLLFKAMGIEKDKDLFDRSSFQSKITGEKLNWKDLYERVDLEKVTTELKKMKRGL